MKKLLFILLVPVFALAQSSNQNYIKTTIYKGPTGTNPSSQVTYFDGFGRPIQKVDNAQSNTGKDIVTHIEYDSYGRQPKDFLPYPSAQNNMLYIDGTTASAATTTHYQGAYNDTNPYSEKLFEPSPLNRVLEQAAPGAAWSLSATTKHTIRLDYQTNSANEVKIFKANASWDNTKGLYNISITNPADYSANELYKTVTKNENWTSGTNNTTEEFKDKEERVVLKRTYGTSIKNGVPVNEKHDTYYVYDQFGNLTYVIPPLADGAFDQNTLNGLCYQYKYDQRNRLVEKKLPGKQWEFIVYDKLDRVVATGPALSPFSNFSGYGWLITKYDVFNRPILTAWEQSTADPTTRATKQNGYNSATSNNESKITSSTTVNGVSFNYSNNISPTSYHVLTVNYYDDYLFPHAETIPTTVLGQSVTFNNTQKPKGLPTGSWVRITETSALLNAEKSITYYDYKARPIRTKIVNHLGGYTQIDSNLDFIGKTIYTESRHKRVTGDPELLTREDFTYSAQDRLLTHTHQINGGTKQLLVSNTYDELGQLITKKVGGTDATGAIGLQKVDYKYTIRGWLKDINNVDNLSEGTNPQDLFAFRLRYNDNVTSGLPANQTAVDQLFNGNISETFWRTAADNKIKKYGYNYDQFNRLTNAIYQDPVASVVTNSFSESLAYDKNGNITSLNRKGYLASTPFNTTIDALTYTYGPINKNELRKVDDTTNDTKGFKNGINTNDDYEYDLNGNMVQDRNKGITTNISYNHLNLPVKIIFPTGNIEYLYNASGQKVQKIVTVGTTPTTTLYLGGYQYINNVLDFFPHAEGYVKRETTGAYTYVFNHKDHLGNVRISYKQNGSSLQILEESNYYPFGLKHEPNAVANNQPSYKYKYNGKELQDELGLNVTAMDYRQYDSAIGRFNSIDALSEFSFSTSPFSFARNNPIFWADPTGLISQSAIDAMWNNSAENASTTWTNNGGGNFDSSTGNGWVNAESGTFNEFFVSLPEVQVSANSSSWASSFEQHTYENSPFYESNWYQKGGRINAVAGTIASAIENLSGIIRVGTNTTFYTATSTGRVFYGNQYVNTFGVAKIGTAFGRASVGAGFVMDGIGVYVWYQNPKSKNAVHPAKMGLNTTMGLIGLEGGPPGAILSGIYFLGDAFIPGTAQEPSGGWPAAIDANARNTEANRAILGSSWSPRPCGGL